jgi:hypothetical protein
LSCLMLPSTPTIFPTMTSGKTMVFQTILYTGVAVDRAIRKRRVTANDGPSSRNTSHVSDVADWNCMWPCHNSQHIGKWILTFLMTHYSTTPTRINCGSYQCAAQNWLTVVLNLCNAWHRFTLADHCWVLTLILWAPIRNKIMIYWWLRFHFFRMLTLFT